MEGGGGGRRLSCCDDHPELGVTSDNVLAMNPVVCRTSSIDAGVSVILLQPARGRFSPSRRSLVSVLGALAPFLAVGGVRADVVALALPARAASFAIGSFLASRARFCAHRVRRGLGLRRNLRLHEYRLVHAHAEPLRETSRAEHRRQS